MIVGMRRFTRVLIYLLVVAIIVVVAVYSYYRYRYPYGSHHVCDSQMSKSLMIYATDHGGKYPSGEPTPEASLSLLYPKYLSSPTIIAGKGGSIERATKILKSGGRLGPNDCNWHYVEGLNDMDSSELAILWDKLPGLGHNCDRLKDGLRGVVYVGGSCEYIPEAKWEEFLAQQNKLLSQRTTSNKQGAHP
jgi:hypothetical protein